MISLTKPQQADFLRMRVVCRQWQIEFQKPSNPSKPRMLTGFELRLLNRLELLECART